MPEKALSLRNNMNKAFQHEHATHNAANHGNIKPWNPCADCIGGPVRFDAVEAILQHIAGKWPVGRPARWATSTSPTSCYLVWCVREMLCYAQRLNKPNVWPL